MVPASLRHELSASSFFVPSPLSVPQHGSLQIYACMYACIDSYQRSLMRWALHQPNGMGLATGMLMANVLIVANASQSAMCSRSSQNPSPAWWPVCAVFTCHRFSHPFRTQLARQTCIEPRETAFKAGTRCHAISHTDHA